MIPGQKRHSLVVVYGLRTAALVVVYGVRTAALVIIDGLRTAALFSVTVAWGHERFMSCDDFAALSYSYIDEKTKKQFAKR